MPTSRFARVAPFIALPLFALMAAMQVRFAIMGDKGWLMLAANEWVSGKKIAVDIFEVNPPLILWLYGLPVWVSRHLPFITDYAAMGLMGVAATLLVIWLSMRLIARHPAFAEDANRKTEFAVLLGGILIFIISPVYFFDREHIMLTLTFPYMLRFLPSLSRERYSLGLRLIIGLLAAIGFAIKPHTVLVFLALQLWYLLRDRSPHILASVENMVIYFFGAAYLASIAYFAPDYLTTVLPMALTVYSSYNIRQGALQHNLPLAFFATVIPLLDFRPRYAATPFRGDIYSLMVVAVIYLGYALTNNGWGYTFQPFFSILAFLTAWLLWEYDWLKRQHVARSLPSKQFDAGIKGCIYCLSINAVYTLFVLHSLLLVPDCGGYSGCEGNKPYVDAIRDKKIRSFGVMSGEFTRWPQISRESGARWDTRFNHLWMVPGLAKAQEDTAHSELFAGDRWIVKYVGQAFADDLGRRKPDAVFVDESDEFFTYPHHPYDVLKLLETVPEFKQAWKYYRFDSTINRCKSKNPDNTQTVGCRYDIYTRKESP